MITSYAGLTEEVRVQKQPEYLNIRWKQYKTSMLKLALKIHSSGWAPDNIICIGRGGNPVGDALSRLFKKPMGVIMCSSYTGESEMEQSKLKIAENISITTKELKGKLLLVDDLVDSGKTLIELSESIAKQNPHLTEIRTAVIYKKTCTKFQPDYHAEVTKDGVWIFLPNEIFDRVPLEKIPKESLKGLDEIELQKVAEEIFSFLPTSPLDLLDVNLLEIAENY